MILHRIDKDLRKDSGWNDLLFKQLCETSLAIISDSFRDGSIVVPLKSDFEGKKDHAWNIAISSVYFALKLLDIRYQPFEKFATDWGTSLTPDLVKGIGFHHLNKRYSKKADYIVSRI